MQESIMLEKKNLENSFKKISKTIEGLEFSGSNDFKESKSFNDNWKLKLDNLHGSIDNFLNDEFMVSFLGTFNSGKSTLINAILGEAILPTANYELTNAITKICFSDRQGIELIYDDGLTELVEYNPQDLIEYVTLKGSGIRKIKQLNLKISNELLKNGICLLDTPGLGGVYYENTLIAQNCIPNSSLIVFVMKATEIGGSENLKLINMINRLNFAENARIVFAITNTDRLDEKELTEGYEHSLV